MGVKYYTYFVLEEAEAGPGSEFSGVVEVERMTNCDLELDDVRYMLAENLQVDVDDLTVLQWSRLH